LGVLATIPYEIFTRIMLFFKIGKYSVYELSSLIVTIRTPDLFLGIVIATVVGGTIAVIIYYSLIKLIGCGYVTIKTTLISILCWVMIETVYTGLIEGPGQIRLRPINDYYIQMFGTVIFGIVMGILFKKYLLGKQADLIPTDISPD
jgi:hypothetical protein